MKVYILVDKNKIIREIASEEVNLNKKNLHMDKYHVEFRGIIGDEYSLSNDTWIARPENYLQPTDRERHEVLIRNRKHKIVRNQAIAELIAEGLLPPDYESGDDDA